MINWFKVAVDAAIAQPEDGAAYLLGVADGHAAAELDVHVGYYDRAAADISQALEHVEDHGSEAAIALRSVQRTMSSVATALRRRAAELRGDVPRAVVPLAEVPPCEVCGGRGTVNHLLASPPDAPMPCRDCSPEAA